MTDAPHGAEKKKKNVCICSRSRATETTKHQDPAALLSRMPKANHCAVPAGGKCIRIAQRLPHQDLISRSSILRSRQDGIDPQNSHIQATTRWRAPRKCIEGGVHVQRYTLPTNGSAKQRYTLPINYEQAARYTRGYTGSDLHIHLEKSGSARGFVRIYPCSSKSLCLGKGEALMLR